MPAWAVLTASRVSDGSMRASTCPFLTTDPTSTARTLTVPPALDFTSTVDHGCNVPVAETVLRTGPSLTVAKTYCVCCAAFAARWRAPYTTAPMTASAISMLIKPKRFNTKVPLPLYYADYVKKV